MTCRPTALIVQRESLWFASGMICKDPVLCWAMMLSSSVHLYCVIHFLGEKVAGSRMQRLSAGIFRTYDCLELICIWKKNEIIGTYEKNNIWTSSAAGCGHCLFFFFWLTLSSPWMEMDEVWAALSWSLDLFTVVIQTWLYCFIELLMMCWQSSDLTPSSGNVISIHLHVSDLLWRHVRGW